WAKIGQRLGAGEIVLNSINADGTKNGFSIDILDRLVKELDIPIIASGGAGNKEHFLEVFEKSDVDAGLAASIFHNKQLKIKDLKKYLAKNNIKVRL
ncbi:MAG: HisA/HisF-related TIM barrel protein, partial [Bacillota bacterium]